MIELFTRDGMLFTGNYRTDARGNAYFTRARKCSRCGGVGGSDHWRLTGWTCFKCEGRGVDGEEVIKLYTAEKLAKLNERKAKADAKRQAARDAEAEERAREAEERAERFRAENAELLARAAAHMDNEFIADVIRKATERSQITEAQTVAVWRAIERIERKRRLAAASQHVGTVGQRIERAVKVERVSEFCRPKFNAEWLTETVFVVTMRDDEGNSIVSMSPAFHAEEGERFILRATVREHSTYNGQKQTKVNRAAKKEMAG